jgi:hypothetical protein
MYILFYVRKCFYIHSNLKYTPHDSLQVLIKNSSQFSNYAG